MGPRAPSRVCSDRVDDHLTDRIFFHIDMSAAKHADLLFVKLTAAGESDLSKYCKKEGIEHVEFFDL